MLKLTLAAAVVAAVLYGIKEERVLADAGLLGSCAPVESTVVTDAQWLACKSGRLTEAPDLTRDACVHAGVRAGVDYWRCPAPLVASRSAAGEAQSP